MDRELNNPQVFNLTQNLNVLYSFFFITMYLFKKIHYIFI